MFNHHQVWHLSSWSHNDTLLLFLTCVRTQSVVVERDFVTSLQVTSQFERRLVKYPPCHVLGPPQMFKVPFSHGIFQPLREFAINLYETQD